MRFLLFSSVLLFVVSNLGSFLFYLKAFCSVIVSYLSKIIQDERGKHNDQPGDSNRVLTEVAHIYAQVRECRKRRGREREGKRGEEKYQHTWPHIQLCIRPQHPASPIHRAHCPWKTKRHNKGWRLWISVCKSKSLQFLSSLFVFYSGYLDHEVCWKCRDQLMQRTRWPWRDQRISPLYLFQNVEREIIQFLCITDN